MPIKEISFLSPYELQKYDNGENIPPSDTERGIILCIHIKESQSLQSVGSRL
jgi:hypothetical protein